MEGNSAELQSELLLGATNHSADTNVDTSRVLQHDCDLNLAAATAAMQQGAVCTSSQASCSALPSLQTVLVINNNPDQQPGTFTQLLLSHLTRLNHRWVEARTIEQVTAVARDSTVNISLIISCGSAVVLTAPVDLELHVAKTSAAMLHFPEAPVVGICYGMQLIAQLYGGRLTGEPGTGHSGTADFPGHWHQLSRSQSVSRLRGSTAAGTYWCSNFIFVSETPPNFNLTLLDADGRAMAMEHKHEHVYGV